MTALYCWQPTLPLDPREEVFYDQVLALHQRPRPIPSGELLAFAGDLLVQYRDLTKADETLWGDGPLAGNILGKFINMSLTWPQYEEALPSVVATAARHGLHCYDPQTSEFYPAPGT